MLKLALTDPINFGFSLNQKAIKLQIKLIQVRIGFAENNNECEPLFLP